MISFDVLIRFSCSERDESIEKGRPRKERRLSVKSWTL